jgi:hypothetical protein
VRFFVPRLAIVISAVGSIDLLEGTLVSVLENRPADCEILVALNEPYADPYDLKGEVRFVPSSTGAKPIHCINQALAATRAPFLHLLTSGCQVTEGWTEEALSRFGDRQIGSVAPLVLDAEHRERIFAAGLGYRRGGKRYLVGRGALQPTPEMQAAIQGDCGFAAFYRKSALDLAGGLSPRLGHQQADVDLALALKEAGFSVVLEPRSRIYAVAQVEPAQSPFSKSLYDERLFWRNLSSPGRAGSILSHAGLVTAELILGFPRPRMLLQLAGRVMACCQPIGLARDRAASAPRAPRSTRRKSSPEQMRIDRSHAAGSVSEPTPSRAHSS